MWYVFYGILSVCNVDLYAKIGETWLWRILWLPHSYALDTVVGIGFICIVMYIGVLPKTPTVKKLFQIRKEMSIIGGCILVGHGTMRLSTVLYYLRETADTSKAEFFGYVILDPILLILIIVPWITSFDVLRKKLRAKTWKMVQTYFSVPLFVLMLLFGFVINWAWVNQPAAVFVTPIWSFTPTVDPEWPITLATSYHLSNYLFSMKIYLLMIVSYIVLQVKKIKSKKQRQQLTAKQQVNAC